MQGDATDLLKPEAFPRGAPRIEREAALPELGDPYQASGMPENGEIPLLVVAMGRDGFAPGGTPYYGFEYAHIGNLEFGVTASGQVFHFVYSGMQPKRVSVHGNGLLRIWHLIGRHRLPWIRQADRDFRPAGAGREGEPVITRIEVQDWTRPPPQAEALAALAALVEA